MIVHVVMIKEHDDLSHGWWLDSVHRTRESAQKYIEECKADPDFQGSRMIVISERFYEDYD